MNNKEEILKTLDMMKTKSTNYDYSHTRASFDDPGIYDPNPEYRREFDRCQKLYEDAIEYVKEVLE